MILKKPAHVRRPNSTAILHLMRAVHFASIVELKNMFVMHI